MPKPFSFLQFILLESFRIIEVITFPYFLFVIRLPAIFAYHTALYICRVKRAYKGTACNRTLSAEGRLPLIKVVRVRILRTADPRDYKAFPLKTDFRYAQVMFKRGILHTVAFLCVHSNAFGS